MADNGLEWSEAFYINKPSKNVNLIKAVPQPRFPQATVDYAEQTTEASGSTPFNGYLILSLARVCTPCSAPVSGFLASQQQFEVKSILFCILSP